MASEKVLHINEQNYDSEIGVYKGVALVDLWAEWCAPCLILTPVIEELAEEYEGKAKIGKINVDENQNLAVKFGVTSIPTLIIFKNGEIFDTVIGAVPKSILVDALEKALK